MFLSQQAWKTTKMISYLLVNFTPFFCVSTIPYFELLRRTFSSLQVIRKWCPNCEFVSSLILLPASKPFWLKEWTKKTIVLSKILQLVLFLLIHPQFVQCSLIYTAWYPCFGSVQLGEILRPNRSLLIHSLLFLWYARKLHIQMRFMIILLLHVLQKCKTHSQHTAKMFNIAVVSTAPVALWSFY